MTPVVAINKFHSDTDDEVNCIIEKCKDLKVQCETATVWAEGGNGAIKLAEAVAKTVKANNVQFKPLYDWNMSVKDKINTIATKIYGAKAIDYNHKAKLNLKKIERLGLSHLPICMAKTQKSLSDNPALLGRPKDFVVTVREIEIAAGAGFLIPITGDIMRMPGLPEHPSSEKINITEDGEIQGLF